MKPGQIEQVSEELAANLPVCPKCGAKPGILKRLSAVPPNTEILVVCWYCWDFYEARWHPSLFEAVNIWSLTAKLLGAETPQGVANMAGSGPPTFQGHRGCSLYTDLKTGLIYYWDSNSWTIVTDETPF